MHGNIKCISKGEGTGSIFRVDVPLEACAPGDRPACEEEEAQGDKSVTESAHKIRLVVPRGGPNHRSLLTTLSRWGLSVEDLSYAGLLADEAALQGVWGQMKADVELLKLAQRSDEAQGAVLAPVYIMDVRCTFLVVCCEGLLRV